MKKAFISLYLTLCFLHLTLFIPIWGQGGSDSIRITHTQEMGTLEKQTFVSEYDYVFMTQEPVNYLLKFGPVFNSGNTLSLQYGLEKKIGKSWSINANTYLGSLTPRSVGTTFSAEIEPRFYFKLRNRINKGQSANNLNGSYIGLTLQHPVIKTKDSSGIFAYRSLGTVGISLGWQRRIGTSFYADLSLQTGFRYTQKADCIGGDCGAINFEEPRFTPFLMTAARVGIGSTFRRDQEHKSEICILTKCYETINQLWKIDLLQLVQIDRYYQSSNLGVEYERSIVPGWSLNMGLRLRAEKFEGIRSERLGGKISQEYINNSFITSTFSLETRYFPYIRKRQSKEQIENNLSGPFLFLGFNKEQALSGQTLYLKNPFRVYAGYGLQYKISQRGFFSMQFGLGPRIVSSKMLELSSVSSMKLGFAL